jgi:hypothetical protein
VCRACNRLDIVAGRVGREGNAVGIQCDGGAIGGPVAEVCGSKLAYRDAGSECDGEIFTRTGDAVTGDIRAVENEITGGNVEAIAQQLIEAVRALAKNGGRERGSRSVRELGGN